MIHLKTAFLSLISFMMLFSCSSDKHSTNDDERPNILFIAVDDLRPELNNYGADHIHSPNLDQLAEEGLKFNRAFCNIPVCGASRASLLTGARPTRYRFIGFPTQKDEDFPEATSLPMHFRNNGYTTISNGKIYHHGNDDSLAWNEIWHPKINSRGYLSEKNIRLDGVAGQRGYPYEAMEVDDNAYPDGKIATKGIEDLHKLKDSEKPFFLALGFMKPHLPFNAPKKYWDMYGRDEISLPESYVQPETTPALAFDNHDVNGNYELRRYYGIPQDGHLNEDSAKLLIHGYYACVSYVDAQIGRVIRELEKLDLADNTVIVLWGDHGWNLGEHMLWCKHSTFETSTHTPLMVKVPGMTRGGQTNAITEFIDIYPSLCELAGLEEPGHLEGESFIPLIKGEEREKDYAVTKHLDAVTLIKDSLFYTEWTNDQGQPYARMLFDHQTDPMELNNLAEKEEYQELVSNLSKELRKNWGRDFLSRKNTLSP